jgi:hypothetical protein
MSKTEKTILQVLFPKVRAELLRAFFGTPTKQRYVRELMAITGLAMHTIQDELRKLSAVGLLVSWSNGYHRFYRVDPNHALFDHVHSIVRLSERLPKTRHSALYRQPKSSYRTGRATMRAGIMTASRPPGWDLFKKKRR